MKSESRNDYEKLLLQYQKHYLSNLICSHTDKANMNFSIEARSPFLDKNLFEYTNGIDKKFKNKNGISKIILRDFLVKNNLLKFEKNKKKGFTVPIAAWINGFLKEEILDTINQKEMKSFDFINYDYIQKLLEEHFQNKRNNYKKIYNLFILFKWLKKNNITY